MASAGNSGEGKTSEPTTMAALFLDGVTKFSGDDKTESFAKWAQDLDVNAEIFNWTPQQTLIFARRSLVGTAGLWLKAEKMFKTYEDLKTAVLKEFPDTANTKEMLEAMAARKKQKNERYYEYMLVMKELGRKAKFPDYVAVQYIIDGIENYELTIENYEPDVEKKFKLYEKMKTKSKTATSEIPARKERKLIPKQRCYNCGETDHVASTCQKGIKCFRCNKFGHICSQYSGVGDKPAMNQSVKSYKVVRVCTNDRYELVKVDIATKGPNKTSSSQTM